MSMLVLLPIARTREKMRPWMRGTAGVVLLCGSLAGAAFTVMPARAHRESRDHAGRTTVPRVRGADGAPASAQFAALADSLADDVEHLTRIPSILPTVGLVSSQFALRRYHPIFHVTRPHDGVDIAAPMGAPVIAPAAGIVVANRTEAGYGLLLEIDHGRGVVTRYGHLSRVLVRVGQVVARGQLLANVGNSGISTGPHLHYEIRVAGEAVDPLLFGP
jgi:murein DD-endopeptidase MepM/ murein hydrolase activator NlpD